MYIIRRIALLFTQFLLFIDNTKQSHVRLALTTLKAVGKTIKSPILNQIGNAMKKTNIKTFGNTIKNSIKMFRRNKNAIKNLACGLQDKYLTNVHNFASKSVKQLAQERITKFKYTTPQAVRSGKYLFRTESKKNIQMRSAEQMNTKQLGSLINIISKSKPQFPFLFVAGGLNKLTQLNLVPLIDSKDMNSDTNDIHDIEKMKKMKAYYQENKDIINDMKKMEEMKAQHQKNKDIIKQQNKEDKLKNKEN